MKRVLILGSTGSIGRQTLEVVSRSEEFDVVGLSAGSDAETLAKQAKQYGVTRVALSDQSAADQASEALANVEVLSGAEGLVTLVTEADADLVLNAIVGSAGLGPSIATLAEGIDLALANKESLVVGGELVMALADSTGAQILPVDSEHSALFQLIRDTGPGEVERLVLTASGGPFRGRTREGLAEITVEEALQHPTWEMGGKITIDSATLMNKGLEVIEAHHLFGVGYDQIEVVVHPQSIVHSLVDLCDGATLAHLGYPDMEVPIAYALHYPERPDVPLERLDLPKLGSLTFEEPDREAFPALELARQAGIEGGTAPCVLNAANEIAVWAFLEGKLDFIGISEVIAATLNTVEIKNVHSFEMLYDADRLARTTANEAIEQRMAAR